jgi:hypothetical protein
VEEVEGVGDTRMEGHHGMIVSVEDSHASNAAPMRLCGGSKLSGLDDFIESVKGI